MTKEGCWTVEELRKVAEKEDIDPWGERVAARVAVLYFLDLLEALGRERFAGAREVEPE